MLSLLILPIAVGAGIVSWATQPEPKRYSIWHEVGMYVFAGILFLPVTFFI